MKNKFISLGAVMLGLVLWAPGTLAAAFGVSPPWIENDNLKPGSSFVYMINLSANELEEEVAVKVELEGDPKIAEWLTIENKENIVMSKGQSIVPMAVDVRIPTDAATGRYQGNLKLTLTSDNTQKNQVLVLLGGNIKIDLNVVNYDVIDYDVRSIRAESITEGQAVELGITVKNKGNTVINRVPTKATITNVQTSEVVASTTVDKLTLPVYPQDTVHSGLSLPISSLEAGNYWIDTESFMGSKSIFDGRLYLTVEPSTLNNTLQTAVQVTDQAQMAEIKAGVQVMKDVQLRPAAPIKGPASTVQTSVKVQAPFTNQLIIIVIGILVVLTIIVGKMYTTLKKKRR